ncbi:1,2-phenylacetyl-CoA epoxidase subunit PaaD [Gilvimarinus sp. F26214L]|uniref:1,2-phenylacetyl-CoA epoxidase subunit PaaD n=1 Tax=Gilvimarinus sp. DZF01 TaxID=3461371 RepID=UPI004045C0A8
MVTIPTVSAEFAQRVRQRADSPHARLWQLLDQVKDPEIPVLSIWDLGVLQDVTSDETGTRVVITPTYSGCPAMAEIEQDIRALLTAHVNGPVAVEVRLSPAWSTDWMSPEGKQALRQYGIAPPQRDAAGQPVCPQCGSGTTTLVSEFGSTACKALFRCEDCREPFDFFKRL